MNSAAPAGQATAESGSKFPPPPAAIIKVCSCGQPHTARDWLGLKYLGVMDDGLGGWLTLRNCAVCSSTMAVPS